MKRSTVVNTMWQIPMVTEAVSARCPAIWLHCIRSTRFTPGLTPLESSQPGGGEDSQYGGVWVSSFLQSVGDSDPPGAVRNSQLEVETSGAAAAVGPRCWRSEYNAACDLGESRSTPGAGRRGSEAGGRARCVNTNVIRESYGCSRVLAHVQGPVRSI